MFTRYLFKKYIHRYISNFRKRSADAASNMPDMSQKNILMGFWHNWGPEPGQGYRQGMFKEMLLSEVPEAYNVVAVAFMKGNGIPTFKPYKGTDSEFRAEVAKLNAQGRAVLISLGGADAHIELHAGQEAALAAEICRLVEVYGFDGLDIDLEQTAITFADNATVLPAALKLVRDHYKTEGQHFIISMAPEFPYLRESGPYLAYISALENYYDFIAPQYYNQGGDGIWVDELNAWITQNNDDQKKDFLYYLTDSLINGTRGFSSIPADRLAIGLPSNNDGAATGYVIDPQDIKDAMADLESDGNPIRGLMTWSINWDDGKDKDGKPYDWEFVTRYGYLTEGEQPGPDKPPAPAHFRSTTQTTDSITLLWDLVEWNKPVLRYDVYRNGVHLPETTHPPFMDTGLEPGKAYDYQITATDTDNVTSDKSAVISVSTKVEGGGERPTAPTDLHTTEITTTSISLLWNPSSVGLHPLMEYDLIRNGDQIAEIEAPATSFTDSGLTANTQYEYVVFARDTGNVFSGPSNILKTATKGEDGGDVHEWVLDHSYKVDDRVSYEGIVYICIVAHVSNSGWTPPEAFTLWVPYALRAKRR
ncbi:glycosyl hydrolase family 18 protein [Pseudomonas alliivorans]|uniref:chitinase n=1 Tax=Pseudomonas alliivorans TaxID=2810613 RepID=A0ABS4C6F6_9PSED|nr:glycosyl hydrolase family 18 protein [Pseudomonas alliivorans]MBP0945930.1 fibronectin type III domain-containing protein [Pseudomonas alliivorans]MEE4326452.1 glycosyl hydrolase family 18 protein [Pseudomonas alliivorans]MEE4333591.1 glycosyl hydrolase family 18 protein [Pseudomonas alliivorans]MEE4367982.1 glycosyl hydrolase family 18 protein [Pseudomonas alliivorans]